MSASNDPAVNEPSAPASAMTTSSKMVRYLFGRLNLIAAYENKEEFLRQHLSSGYVFDSGVYQWRFIDITRLDVEGKVYFAGLLVKIKVLSSTEVLPRESNEIETLTINDPVLCQ